MEFAFIPERINAYLKALAELAETENWGSEKNGNTHPVLFNYLTHTFSKLMEEEKVIFTKNNEYCCFNTGLLTSFDESIYAVFQKNHVEKPKCTWRSKGFRKDSDRSLYEFCDNKLPERANYFLNPSKLIYNPSKPLNVNYEHIIKDGRDRFPEHIKNKSDNEIKIYLTGVIETIKKRISVNYKIAVPQYYKWANSVVATSLSN